MKKIGFIDYYLDEFHANKYPKWIEDASDGTMKVAYAYALKDKENGVSNIEWCNNYDVQLLDTIEEIVRKSDYLIVLSPDNPELHEQLSQLPLRSGKPTYIDKTFAADLKSALRMFELAEEYQTPIYSTSALRFATEYAELNRAEISVVSSWGPGGFASYAVHQIEPIVALLGSDPKRLMYIGTAQAPAILIDFGDGKQATVHHFLGECPFTMAVQFENSTSKVLKAESNFFAFFIRNLVTFFETSIPTVVKAETLAVMTIIDYGIKAASMPYQWIQLPDNLEGNM